MMEQATANSATRAVMKVKLDATDPSTDAISGGTQPPRRHGWGKICLVALRACKAGEVLLLDHEPLAYAVTHVGEGRCKWCGSSEHSSARCSELRCAYPSPVSEHSDCLLSDIKDSLSSSTTSCNLPELLLNTIASLLDKNTENAMRRQNAIQSLVAAMGDPLPRRAEAQKLLEHGLIRRALPSSLCNEDELAGLLHVLAQFEIQERVPPGGEFESQGKRFGVFGLSNFCRHSCSPNAVQSMQGKSLALVALEPIAAGQAICLDFCGNAGLRPARDRAHALRDAFGIDCRCRLCTTQPDRCRAFVCPAETGRFRVDLAGVEDSDSEAAGQRVLDAVKEGLEGFTAASSPLYHAVCPLGSGSSPDRWRCIACKWTLSEKEWARCIRQEETLRSRAPLTLSDADDLLRNCFIRKEHFLIVETYFRIAKALAMELAGAQASLSNAPSAQPYREAAGHGEQLQRGSTTWQRPELPVSTAMSGNSASRGLQSQPEPTPTPTLLRESGHTTSAASQIELVAELWLAVIEGIDVSAPRAIDARVDLRVQLAQVLEGLKFMKSAMLNELYKVAAQLSREAYGPRETSTFTRWLEERCRMQKK